MGRRTDRGTSAAALPVVAGRRALVFSAGRPRSSLPHAANAATTAAGVWCSTRGAPRAATVKTIFTFAPPHIAPRPDPPARTPARQPRSRRARLSASRRSPASSGCRAPVPNYINHSAPPPFPRRLPRAAGPAPRGLLTPDEQSSAHRSSAPSACERRDPARRTGRNFFGFQTNTSSVALHPRPRRRPLLRRRPRPPTGQKGGRTVVSTRTAADWSGEPRRLRFPNHSRSDLREKLTKKNQYLFRLTSCKSVCTY